MNDQKKNTPGQANFQILQLIPLLPTLIVERWITRQANTHPAPKPPVTAALLPRPSAGSHLYV